MPTLVPAALLLRGSLSWAAVRTASAHRWGVKDGLAEQEGHRRHRHWVLRLTGYPSVQSAPSLRPVSGRSCCWRSARTSCGSSQLARGPGWMRFPSGPITLTQPVGAKDEPNPLDRVCHLSLPGPVHCCRAVASGLPGRDVPTPPRSSLCRISVPLQFRASANTAAVRCTPRW